MEKLAIINLDREDLEAIIRTAIRDQLGIYLDRQPESERRLVAVKELAEITGISVTTLIRRRNDGTIKAYRLGGKVLYDVKEVMESLEKI